MKHTMACVCGHQQDGTAEEQRLGALYRCDGCRQVWAAVMGRNGWKRWVRVAEDEVAFHGLMDEPADTD
jgi:hypothetical protein